MKKNVFEGRIKSIIFLIVFVIGVGVQLKAADFYVSPVGDDNNPGMAEKPFATINKAKEAVRELKKTKTDCGITVLIHGGTYNLNESITFTPEDSGWSERPIIYQACPNEVPILSGEIQIKGWEKLVNEPNLVSMQARGKLWTAKAPIKGKFNQLFANGKLMQRSITPNTDEWEMWPKGKYGKDYSQINVPKELIKDWPSLNDVELNFLSSTTKWINYVLPIAGVEGNTITVKWPANARHLEQSKDYFPVRIENSQDGIDQPGEWCVDTVKNLVYFWPGDDVNMANAKITIPSAITAIVMTGDANNGKFVEHIIVRGLAIERVQNGINMTGVQDCTIDSCRIGPLNMAGITGIQHIQRVTINNCKITDCGRGGISLYCRDGFKDINHHNSIVNNHVYKCGLIDWHSPAIGVGRSSYNIIRQNHIHHMPYAAIAIGGSRFGIWKIQADKEPNSEALKKIAMADRTIYGFKKYVTGYNLVENNLIHDTMMQLDDGGAVYVHASHHNILRNNVVYRSHRKFSFGLYFDDDEMYSTMENNLVYECPMEINPISTMKHRGSGLFIHDNAKNYAYRNITALTYMVFWMHNNYGGVRIMDNIFVVKKNGIDPDKLPRNVGRYRDMGIQWDAGENLMDYNVYWCIDGNEAATEYLKKWQAKGWDKNSNVVNPEFKDITKRDFSFDTSSIAWQMGIRPIDISKVGVQSDFAAVK